MFVTPHGTEALQTLAQQLGCKYGQIMRPYAKSTWDTVHALGGNTFAVKDTLKAAGFRFDGREKCWYHPEADKAGFEQILLGLIAA